MPDIKYAVQTMAAAMSADERILIFMEGVKFAMEQVKAAQEQQKEAKSMKSARDSMPMLDEPTIITCLILLKQHVERKQDRKKMAEDDLLLCEELNDGVAWAKQKAIRAAEAAHTAELALANMEEYAKAAGVFAEEGG